MSFSPQSDYEVLNTSAYQRGWAWQDPRPIRDVGFDDPGRPCILRASLRSRRVALPPSDCL